MASEQAVPAADGVAARRKSRVSLVLGLAILAGMVVGAGAAVLNVFSGPAAGIDRSDPEVVVQQFLTAVYVDESATRVQLFVCSKLNPADAIADVHKADETEAKTSWDTVRAVSRTDTDATVTVRARQKYEGDIAPSGQGTWTFGLIEESGWRVCAISYAR